MIDDEDEEWGSVLETAKLEAELLPPPTDLFEVTIFLKAFPKFLMAIIFRAKLRLRATKILK
jgi:hypothetical protein